MDPPAPLSNFNITRADGSEEVLYGIVFFGVQGGKLLFARPDTVQAEDLEDLPPSRRKRCVRLPLGGRGMGVR